VSTTPSGEEPPRRTDGTRSVRDAIELVGLIIAPATLLTALLFYFGWVRSRAQAAYFGVDVDLLGRSSQDYMLRSIGSIFWPLALLLFAILFASFVHGSVKRLAAAGKPRLLFLLAVFAIVGGAALIVFGVLGVVWRPRAGGGAVLTPVAFALGIPVAAYATLVALSLGAIRRRSRLPSLPRPQLLLVAGLVAVFVFWAVGNYANFRGKKLAARTAAHLKRLPSVTVYSPQRLFLEGLGVEETALTAPDSAYHFRYSGLRLFARAGGKTFLVPSGWCREDDDEDCKQNGVTFVIRDNDTLRLDFSP
jgi:hypothetical protein